MKTPAEKNILVFYPHNFYEMSAGTHRRIYDLLGYFKQRGFHVDLLSLDGYTNRWKEGDMSRRDRFDSVRACRWSPSVDEKLGWGMAWASGGLPDLSIRPLKKAFRELLGSKSYGFVVITYAYWAALADLIGEGPVKVFNFQDFLTLNYHMARGGKRFRHGRMFEGEVAAVSKFKYALCISAEEEIVFRPFCPETEFVDVPISCPERFLGDFRTCDIDVLFVGSENPFNRGGMKWFMEEVHPLVPEDVRITVVGRVCEHVDKKAGNVTLMPRVDDLDGLYRRARLSICPLKGGTGLKIKVVDSLSYGIPVVTTSWGLTGILQKYDNGCYLANNARDFARGITMLINDNIEYLRLKRQAEDFFLKNFSLEEWHTRLDSVFRPGEITIAGKSK